MPYLEQVSRLRHDPAAGNGRDSERGGVAAAMVRLLYRQSNAVLFSNFVIPLPVIYVLRDSAPLKLLLTWMAAVYLLTGLRIGVSRRYFRHGTESGDPQAWARRFMVLSWMSSLLWGMIGSSAFLPPKPELVAFSCIVLTGMSCGAIPSLSAHPATYLGSVLAMLLPFTIFCLVQQNPVYHVYAGFAICLLCVNIYYSRINYRTLREGVMLRFENLSLIDDLERERDRVTAADQAKTRFLAAASHDLRQPVHALGLLAASLAALGQRGDIAAGRALDIGHRLQGTLARMGRLLDGLLDVSRLDAGLMPVRRGPVLLDQLFADLRDEYAVQALQHGCVLRVVPVHAWIDSDADLLKRILDNLLTNAIRHAPGACILLGGRRRKDGIEIQVIDNGPGIAPEQHARVFDEFAQGSGADAAAPGTGHRPGNEQGLGLGLAIVRRLAGLLGHDVRLRSVPGRGSNFSVLVPLASTPQPRHAPSPVPADTPESSALGVMVIDDHPQVLAALSDLLRLWGHHIYPGESVAAVRAAHRHAMERGAAPVHLILADHHLPNQTTGVQAIGLLREYLGNDVPALIVTGDTAPERLVALHDSGFPVLHKPIEAEELRRAMRQAVREHLVV